MTVAPNRRVAHSGVTAVENSPAAWPRVKSAISGSPNDAAAVRAILLAERRCPDGTTSCAKP